MIQSKNHIVILGIILIFLNMAMKLTVIPYVQATTNNHNANGDFLVIAIILLAILFSFIGLRGIFKKKSHSLKFHFLVIGLNLSIWIPVLINIECKNCSMA